jgi:hypothetical protein
MDQADLELNPPRDRYNYMFINFYLIKIICLCKIAYKIYIARITKNYVDNHKNIVDLDKVIFCFLFQIKFSIFHIDTSWNWCLDAMEHVYNS